MPSAAAKVEKIASYEAADPVKQIVNMLEKRMRNLEKRKIKLDGYKLDVKNGKELNDDQKAAVSKYDEVECVLEFSKELTKSMNSTVLESARQQKKLAKKEQLERQQHEIQRLQEAFIYCHILSCFQNEDVRSDFLNGENVAVQLTSEQLSQLDQLYKLIGPGLPSEQADLSNHFHTLAENHIFLVEGKNKEIVGTTYKVLKDLLQSIKECGYFSRPSGPVEEDVTSSDDMPEDEVVLNDVEQLQEVSNDEDNEDVQEKCEDIYDADAISAPASVHAEEVACKVSLPQSGPVNTEEEDRLFFLQDSQLDPFAPHMDPAVVAVHQMAPPPAVNYAGNTYPASLPIEESLITNGPENRELLNQSPLVNKVPVMPAAIPRTVAPVLASTTLANQQEFDPSHPIPTQTFTNQSFAVMQNMIIPQGYVPVTMHHGPMPPHIAPVAVVPGLSPPVTSGAPVIPLQVPVAPVSVAPVADLPPRDTEQKNEVDDAQKLSAENAPDNQQNSNNGTNEKNGENGYAQSYRGGYRRGRGRSNNGFFRGRSSYNGRGGGFQNHYYQDRNGYNGNYRRVNNRGPRGNGNNRPGRGNYRTHQDTPAQRQQQQPQE